MLSKSQEISPLSNNAVNNKNTNTFYYKIVSISLLELMVKVTVKMQKLF